MKAGRPSPSGRLSFTTWHHWTKDDTLLESGLFGPVKLERTGPANALDPFVPGNRSSGLFNMRKQELLQNLFRRMDPEAMPVIALDAPGIWTLAGPVCPWADDARVPIHSSMKMLPS